ncbi:MAG: aminotransferase class V-fold PLP-dependent enzyme [Methylococcales bacterium]|jgi:cysteine desulfurase / selenocysteine lyase|nr:aminotransferase class V-fold PLP-dependent enzyme [Methylococcales bacterium]MBT7443182.1 aminotransferase class V-fold PLP-dependent enzyme [Methylococcales bacterium]
MTNWQNEFPQAPDLCYLNHAAVGVWPLRANKAVKHFADENLSEGATGYLSWLDTEKKCRQRLQRLVNASSTDEIALVKNTSEALSFVAYGIDWAPGDEIVIPDTEFPSNRIVWESLQSQGVKVIPVNIHQGNPEQAIIAACNNKTRLVSVSSVQFGTGLMLNLQQLGEHCSKSDILYCVDAIQSVGAFSFDVQRCHIDFAMADGHKWMFGPEGLGFFYCRQALINTLKLHQYGWRMLSNLDFDQSEWQPSSSATRFECGSPNMLAIHALEASLSLIEEVGVNTIEQAILQTTGYLVSELQKHASINIISNQDNTRKSGIITFISSNKPSKSLYHELMKQRIICAYRGGGIRFSPHFYTTKATIDLAITRLFNIID